MKVQIYFEDGMARIFDAEGNGMCDVWADNPAGSPRANADAAMKRIRIVRRGDWKRYGWGYEASVRFMPARGAR